MLYSFHIYIEVSNDISMLGMEFQRAIDVCMHGSRPAKQRNDNSEDVR